MIYICHHAVPDYTLDLPMFSTLVTGVAAPPDGAFKSDLDGENISAQLEHSEMRQQFYVWRNTLKHYDYVGFEHYRRLFFLDPLLDDQIRERFPFIQQARFKFLGDQHMARLVVTRPEFDAYVTMRRQLTFSALENLKSWIASHDIIVQRPLFSMALDEQWKTTHMADMWDTLVEATLQNRYFDHHPMQIDFAMKTPHYCNMYIMKAALFDEYMHFWWDSMTYIKRRITVSPRVLGHFSERLFNFFLMQKRMESPLLRVGMLPHLFLDKQAA
jgi:hypothetical protein